MHLKLVNHVKSKLVKEPVRVSKSYFDCLVKPSVEVISGTDHVEVRNVAIRQGYHLQSLAINNK